MLRLTEARSGARVCDPQHLRNVSKPDTHGSNVQTDQGQWQSPSAQAARLLTFDPGVVLDTSARNAFLNSFNGVSIDGTWSLFVTDLSSGGTQQLDGWGLQIMAVPEPAFTACAVALGLLGFAFYRRSRARASIR